MRERRAICGVVLGVLLALGVGAPARAQVPCSTVCSRYDQGQCVEYTHYSCEGIKAPPPSYGAIAYGRTSGAWGTSYQWTSQSKAESVAMQNCKEHGDDCEVMVWFKQQCGAVAAADGKDAFWGLGANEGQARAQAQRKCEDAGGKGCEIQAAQCSK